MSSNESKRVVTVYRLMWSNSNPEKDDVQVGLYTSKHYAENALALKLMDLQRDAIKYNRPLPKGNDDYYVECVGDAVMVEGEKAVRLVEPDRRPISDDLVEEWLKSRSQDHQALLSIRAKLATSELYALSKWIDMSRLTLAERQLLFDEK